MKPKPLGDDLLRPTLRVAMPRAACLYAPEGTVHVVARCNNREFCFTTPEDFELLLAHLREMIRTYDVTLYAYTLMSNHIHLLHQAPRLDALGRPLRWFMTETAKAFHRIRKRRGHLWERRYRACLVEDDRYALAALRYLDRNPVRAGLVEDPATYPWSSCPAYALGTPTPPWRNSSRRLSRQRWNMLHPYSGDKYGSKPDDFPDARSTSASSGCRSIPG